MDLHDTVVKRLRRLDDTDSSSIRQHADLPCFDHQRMRSIFVTGAAGFIGSHLSKALAVQGFQVKGCDLLPAPTLLALQEGRLQALTQPVGVEVMQLDICETDALVDALRGVEAETVVHLAALPGVRASAMRPLAYAQANLVGFTSVLEACRRAGVKRLLYASSSSVYGHRGGQFAESDRTGPPTSFYAATKMANEAMALAYRSQMGLDAVGLRFFTVYGPWGRPDMAPFLFAQAIRQGRPIRLHGHGRPRRDFTHVADAVDALVRLVSMPSSLPLPEILNVGHGQPITLLEFVRLLEDAIGQSATLEMHDLPPDDVAYTCADDRLLQRVIGPLQHTPMTQGLGQLASWLHDWDPLPTCPPASTS